MYSASFTFYGHSSGKPPFKNLENPLYVRLLLSGFECWMENSTVYAPESGGKAEVKINPKDSVELPVGEYLFKTLYGDKMCGYFVNVKGEGLIMTYI